MKFCRKSLLSRACTKDNREVEVDCYFSSVDPLQLLINRSVFSSNLCFFKSFCKVTSGREKHKTPPRLFSLCFWRMYSFLSTFKGDRKSIGCIQWSDTRIPSRHLKQIQQTILWYQLFYSKYYKQRHVTAQMWFTLSYLLFWNVYPPPLKPFAIRLKSRVLLEKLTGPQLVKKFSSLYVSWMFITAFTSTGHLFLSWARSI